MGVSHCFFGVSRSMKTIPAHIVDSTWREINNLAPSDAQQLMERLGEEQPVLMAYLMAAEGDVFNPDERSLFAYLGLVVWQIMARGDSALPPVSEDRLETAEAANIRMLEYLEGETEADFSQTVQTLTHHYNQIEVLRFVLEALMEQTDGSNGIRTENTGLVMIHLKSIIDCLDQNPA